MQKETRSFTIPKLEELLMELFNSKNNAPTGRLAGLSVQQKHVDAQKMLYFTVFLALEGS